MSFQSTPESEYPTLEQIGDEAKAGNVYARLLIQAMKLLAESAQPYPSSYTTVLNVLVYDLSTTK